jgi:hypothetical protein
MDKDFKPGQCDVCLVYLNLVHTNYKMISKTFTLYVLAITPAFANQFRTIIYCFASDQMLPISLRGRLLLHWVASKAAVNIWCMGMTVPHTVPYIKASICIV